MGGGRKIWVCFLNDDDFERSGFFELVDETLNYIKILSGENILTIPFHRIKKVKEAI